MAQRYQHWKSWDASALEVNNELLRQKELQEEARKLITHDRPVVLPLEPRVSADPTQTTENYGEETLFHVGLTKQTVQFLNACSSGVDQEVEEQLLKGIDVNSCDSTGKTALMFACHNNNIQIVLLLLRNRAEINKQDMFRGTALIYAARHGHIGVVMILLDTGAYLDVQDINGMTALMLASYCNHLDICKALISKGADVSIAVTSMNANTYKWFGRHPSVFHDLNDAERAEGINAMKQAYEEFLQFSGSSFEFGKGNGNSTSWTPSLP